MTCTLATEAKDCTYPKVCIVVNSTAQQAYCGCITNYGYAGDMCDVSTPSTKGILAYTILLSLCSLCVGVWAWSRLLPVLIENRTIFGNQLVSVALLSACGLAAHLIYALIGIADIVGGAGVAAVRDIDGIRVTWLYDAFNFALMSNVCIGTITLIFISGAWFQLGRRSMQLQRVKEKDSKRVRQVSYLCGITVAVVSLALFFSKEVGILYMFWGVVGVVLVLCWGVGVTIVTRALTDGVSNESFSRALRKIRRTATRIALALALLFVSVLIQVFCTTTAGHEHVPITFFPPWLAATTLGQINILIVFYLAFYYAIQALTKKSNVDEVSSANSKAETTKRPTFTARASALFFSTATPARVSDLATSPKTSMLSAGVNIPVTKQDVGM